MIPFDIMKKLFSSLTIYARRAVNSSLLTLVLLPFTAHSEDNIWLPNSGIWNDPNNWSSGSVPNLGSENFAIVGSGRTATVPGFGALSGSELLLIGDNGQGTVSIGLGADFRSGATLLGRNSSLGVAHVWGSATWTNYDEIVLGGTGQGELNIDGGHVETGSLIIGLIPEISGKVMLDSGSFTVYGDARIGERGTGEVTISSGLVQFENVVMGLRAGSEGSIMLSNSAGSRGVLEARSFTKGEGSSNITFDGGILRAESSQSDVFLNFASGDVTFNAGGGFIDTNGFNLGIANVLVGTGGLTKQGAGNMTLGGPNAYQGGTTVEGGTLTLNHNNSLGTGEVKVNTGTLHINEGVAPTNAITLADGGSVERDFGSGADLTNALTATSSLAVGAETTFNILGGTTSATTTLTASFAVTSGASNDMMRQSDILGLSGVPVVDIFTGETDVFVLQLQMSSAAPESILAWLDPNTDLWVNAVDGNFGGTSAFQGDGAYNSSTDFVLGYYGVDSASNSVWAVINHNSEFGVVNIPEPSVLGLLGIGLCGVFIRRQR